MTNFEVRIEVLETVNDSLFTLKQSHEAAKGVIQLKESLANCFNEVMCFVRKRLEKKDDGREKRVITK